MQTYRRDGIGRFTFHVLEQWVAAHPHIDFYLLLSRKEDMHIITGNHVHPIVLPPVPRHPLLNVMWLESSVATFLKKLNPDIYIGMDGMLVRNWKGVQLSVMHDINFMHDRGFVKFSDRLFYRYLFPLYAKQAAAIASVSHFSKLDISTHYKIENNNIHVVYNGVAPHFMPLQTDQQMAAKQAYTNGNPYFFFVGALSPRKNIERMLLAFEQFSSNTNQVYYFVISGSAQFRTVRLYSLVKKMKYGNRVVFTGAVSDAVLHGLMASAIALVFVPIFEGFGIPPLEAMQCGVPVIASNTTSVPEVVGDAALLVDPYDITDITNAMQRIATEPEMCRMLIEKGFLQAKQFSWENTAQSLWKVVGQLINVPKND